MEICYFPYQHSALSAPYYARESQDVDVKDLDMESVSIVHIFLFNCQARALGLLLADGVPTVVGRGKTFWRVYCFFFLMKTAITQKR